MDYQKTKEEVLNEIGILKVNIWSNPNRPDDVQTNECEYCGKKCGKNPRYVHVTTSGLCVPNDITEEDMETAGLESQGCFAIGDGCAKKLFGKQVDNYTSRL